jgi:aldehyde:ferredoxin oxidoreductase
MYGWQGIILRVDLTSGKISKEPLNQELAHKYVGGRGLNSKLLYDEVEPGTDPLGPHNKLIFGTGPACGTLVPGGQRWTLTCKATLSNFLSDANCGSRFGVALKYAGYDVLIIEGKSDRPVYLLIDGDNVSIKDASHIWGKTTTEATRILETEIGTPDVRVVSIGQAGENLVKFSSVISENRAAARAGGAVMGSKKLKAIAARGNKGVKIADRKMLEKVASEVYQMRHSGELSQRLKMARDEGIFASIGAFAELGMVGTKNYREGTWPEYRSKVAAPGKKRFARFKPCFSCPFGCSTSHLWVITEGPYAGTAGEDFMAPAHHYVTQIGNPNVDFMFKLAALSDEYGMDNMATGGVIGFAMECYEAGILTPSDLGGLKLEWGNIEATGELFDMIAFRRGIGNVLAEGATAAARVIGKESEKYVMEVKGQAVDVMDPRGSKGYALGYAVAARGGEHCRVKMPIWVAPHWSKEYLKEMFKFEGRELDSLHEEHMGEMYKWYEDVQTFEHLLETCVFLFAPTPDTPRLMATLYNAVTGLEIIPSEILTIGERVTNLERGFNIREGLTRKDDSLPDRFTKEPMPDGPLKGQIVNLEPMVSEYYEFRGWDKDTGVPTRKKLEELGLEEVARDIL